MSSGGQSVTLTADPTRVRDVLLRIAAIVFVLSLLAQCMRRWEPGSPTAHVLTYLDATREFTIPTFFSSMVLLACAGLAALAARRDAIRPGRWWMLAAVLVAFALDESIGFHESTIKPLRRILDAGGIFYSTWVVAGIAFVVSAAVLFKPVIGSLGKPARAAALVGIGLFVLGAVGLELAGGWAVDRYGNQAAALVPLETVEEGFEMVGVALFLYALMLHLAPTSATIRLRERS